MNPNLTANFKKIYNMSFDLNEDLSDNNYKWTCTESDHHFLVGREALTIYESEKYEVHYPIKYGFFNNQYTYFAVLNDLRNIIEWCLIQVLQLKRKDFTNYNIILIIPDIFIKIQVKGLINLFLRILNFKAIIVQIESVSSSFGTALQSCCVVDIGSQKTNVSCVDEGFVLEESIIRKNFGGDDLTEFLKKSLQRKTSTYYFPSAYFINDNVYHHRIIEKLKETECEFPNVLNPTSYFINKNCKVWIHNKHKNTKTFNITLSDALYMTPIILFNPVLLETFRNITIPSNYFYNDIYEEDYKDAEDVMADLIENLITNQEKEGNLALQTPNKKEKKEKNNNNNINNQNIEMEDSLSVSNSRSEDNNSNNFDEGQCNI